MFFTKKPSGTRIFVGIDYPMPDFKSWRRMSGQASRKSYILDDGTKLKSIVEKWRFEPGGSVGRCGYDYQIVLTNGGLWNPCFYLFSL